MSPGVIIPSWPQTTSCNFRATENSSFKWSINPWRPSQPSPEVLWCIFLSSHFSFLLSLNFEIEMKRFFLRQVLAHFTDLSLWILFSPPVFCCRLLYTKSIFLEKFWWPVKAEMLTIKTLGYSHKWLCKVWGSMPDEQMTHPFIISRNRHINWLWCQYHPSALTKLFLILNVPQNTLY